MRTGRKKSPWRVVNATSAECSLLQLLEAWYVEEACNCPNKSRVSFATLEEATKYCNYLNSSMGDL